MRTRKGSFSVGDAAEAASSPPEESGPSDGVRRGECLGRVSAQ